jgi:outer membrane murein-binding lipoprotein Lpp
MPWWKYDAGNPTVSLGCGTLLAIGVIVALCSGGISKSQFNDLRGDLRRLENKVEAVDASLKQLAPEKAAAPANP